MRLQALLVSALVCGAGACGGSNPVVDAGPSDAALDANLDTGSDAGPDADLEAARCVVPDGAHPSVQAAQPVAGWRCERLPFGLGAPRDVAVDGDDVFVTEISGGRIQRWTGDGFEQVATELIGPVGLRVLDAAPQLVA